MKKSKLFTSLALGLALSVSPSFAKSGKQDEFYENVSRLNKVLLEINRKYVEDVNSDDLTNAAIRGLRSILDPHTAVFSPDDYKDLKVSTEGEFGGLGITIAIRDNILTIIAPLHNTPAYRMGLQSGDRIVKIADVDTKGISIEGAVDKLRGRIGTSVKIKIAREGEGDLLEFDITRGKIVIKSVPYQGMLTPDIGYIRVASFAKNTGRDVEKAIANLKTEGMKKFILDLRYNPGGLLTQAIELGDLFLEKDQLVVSTKGRTQETEAYSENAPLLPVDVPMVVLVNGGSASASEIVSGAIQDWDRGIIMGETSFGKGSVQTIYPLDHEGHALKMTTAFYYLPKGRCINKAENGIQGLSVEIKGDSTKADSSSVEFKTNNGRVMYSEGGISPDIEIKPEYMDWLEQLIERKNFFFRYMVKNRPKIESQGLKVNAEWQVDASMIKDFKNFLLADTNFTQATTGSDKMIKVLVELLTKEKSLPEDSTKHSNDLVGRKIKELKSALKQRRKEALGTHEKFLRRGLKREFLMAFQGDKESTRFNLESDKQVKEAIKVLNDEEKYRKILSGELTLNNPKTIEDAETAKSTK